MEMTAETQTQPTKEKKLYYYQQKDIDLLFNKLGEQEGSEVRLLYQLPTGGGKTVIFSEIAKRFIQTYKKKVIVLTHRTELCTQTTAALRISGVVNKVVHSGVKKISKKDHLNCYVAMVETLKHRIDDGLINTSDIGLVIVDEAHHNSFQKLLGRFQNAAIIGVTATPFSADINLPMNKFYKELITGVPITSLIEQGFLAKPKVYEYNVELNTLRTGRSGDFTIGTSDELFGSPVMLELLLHAYQSHSFQKKTLIFNNGIFSSRKVLEVFSAAGYPIRHLDNKTLPAERVEILKWYKRTKGAILTSVSLLTTGFDEPSIQSIILYRATTSLTLYHQMIGRGARRLNGKKTFNIIDMGNNIERFGEWNAPVDWNHVFEKPEIYHESLHRSTSDMHQISPELRSKFPNSLEVSFDVLSAYQAAMEKGEKAKIVIRDSIRQHALMCVDNSEVITDALKLCTELEKEIDYRVKQYGKCLGKVTKDYLKWLRADYRNRLDKLIHKIMGRRKLLSTAI
jgi:superfamily II DNA or RNA helicase